MEPAQRMTVIELLEHQWLNDGTVPDVPLDTPSIIVSDEVSLSKFDVVRLRGVPLSLCLSCVMRKKTAGKNGPANLKKRACCLQDFWPPIVSSQFPKCSRMDNAEDNIDEKMILYVT